MVEMLVGVMVDWTVAGKAAELVDRWVAVRVDQWVD